MRRDGVHGVEQPADTARQSARELCRLRLRPTASSGVPIAADEALYRLRYWLGISAVSDDTETYDLVKMRTAVHEAETQLAHLKLRIQTGELLDRRMLVQEMASMGHRHRDLLMSLPIRHASIIANELGINARLLLVAMEKLIRRELQEIAAAARSRAGGDGAT